MSCRGALVCMRIFRILERFWSRTELMVVSLYPSLQAPWGVKAESFSLLKSQLFARAHLQSEEIIEN